MISALIEVSEKFKEEMREKFDGRIPIKREIVGYSKGYWAVEYTFKTEGGYSFVHRWEQDERSLAHQERFPHH